MNKFRKFCYVLLNLIQGWTVIDVSIKPRPIFEDKQEQFMADLQIDLHTADAMLFKEQPNSVATFYMDLALKAYNAAMDQRYAGDMYSTAHFEPADFMALTDLHDNWLKDKTRQDLVTKLDAYRKAKDASL